MPARPTHRQPITGEERKIGREETRKVKRKDERKDERKGG
jgi:hypothetical protein